MAAPKAVISIRPCESEDLPALCDLVNEIVMSGSATMLDAPFTLDAFVDHFLTNQIQIACLVADAGGGEVCGFQVLWFHEKLPEDWAEIATFVSTSRHMGGVGAALFDAMADLAVRCELSGLNATLRADNPGGIAYYKGLGFVERETEKGVRLRSGRRADCVYLSRRIRRFGPGEEIVAGSEAAGV